MKQSFAKMFFQKLMAAVAAVGIYWGLAWFLFYVTKDIFPKDVAFMYSPAYDVCIWVLLSIPAVIVWFLITLLRVYRRSYKERYLAEIQSSGNWSRAKDYKKILTSPYFWMEIMLIFAAVMSNWIFFLSGHYSGYMYVFLWFLRLILVGSIINLLLWRVIHIIWCKRQNKTGNALPPGEAENQ